MGLDPYVAAQALSVSQNLPRRDIVRIKQEWAGPVPKPVRANACRLTSSDVTLGGGLSQSSNISQGYQQQGPPRGDRALFSGSGQGPWKGGGGRTKMQFYPSGDCSRCCKDGAALSFSSLGQEKSQVPTGKTLRLGLTWFSLGTLVRLGTGFL